MPDRDTAIKAGVSGGVSAIMPYVAIGVLGLLGLRELKKLNLDVGGAAGQVIDTITDTVTNIIDNTKTSIVNVYDGVIDPLDEFTKKGSAPTKELSTDTFTAWNKRDMSRVGVYSEGGVVAHVNIDQLPKYKTGKVAGGLTPIPVDYVPKASSKILPEQFVYSHGRNWQPPQPKDTKVSSGTTTPAPYAYTPPTKAELVNIKPDSTWKVVK